MKTAIDKPQVLKMYLLIFLMLSLALVCRSQTTRICDNNTIRPTGANIYTTLQAAVDAAVNGDIIYVTPSLTGYGGATIAKQLTLQGAGHNVSELGSRISSVGAITLYNGASGSIIKDLKLTGSLSFTQVAGTFTNIVIDNISMQDLSIVFSSSASIENLTIKNSNFGPLNGSALTKFVNVKIYNNIVGVIGNFYHTTTIEGTGIDNVIITNNLIYGFTSLRNTNGAIPNAFIQNNVFSFSGGDAFFNLENVIVRNNIFYGIYPGSISTSYVFGNNMFINNLVSVAGTMPPPGNGGLTNDGMGNITETNPQFVNAAVTNVWSSSYNYNLNSGSPCKNAGSDGTDIGATGGLYPIDANVKFLPTRLPIITDFKTSGVTQQDQPIKVNVKAKSN